MKFILRIFLIVLIIMSCKGKEGENTVISKQDVLDEEISLNEPPINVDEFYKQYGAKVSTSNILREDKITETYAALKEGDTASVTFMAPIHSVCASKGCWMRLDLEEEEVFVKFKDYGFFVPTDTDGGDAIVQGKAYLEEVSIEELKHMAADGGQSQSEIDAIIAPQRELRFMADGVAIKGK